MMIMKKNEASLTVQAKIVLGAIGVLGFLTRKGEIDVHDCIGGGGSPSGRITTSTLLEFGFDTDGTIIENRNRPSKFGDAVGTFVGFVEVIIRATTKALMPQPVFFGPDGHGEDLFGSGWLQGS